MSKKLVLALIVTLCVLVGACSREQTQQAAGSQSAGSEEQQKQEQQLAEQQKKIDEQQKKLDEQQQRLAEQQKAAGASSPGQSAGNEAASQAGSAAATAPNQPAPAPVEPAAPPKPPEPVYVTLQLEPGTPVVARTTAEISTKTAKTGETFVATLEEPLSDGDKVIAARGAEVAGRVVESDQGGRAKGKAKISVELVSLTTASGKKIPISTVALTQEAGSTAKKDLKRTGIATGVGAAVGAIAGGGKGAAIGAGVGAGAGVAANLATRGDPSVIPSETVLRFELAQSVAVKTQVDQTSKAE